MLIAGDPGMGKSKLL